MATINGLTAEAMQAIIDRQVVSGAIDLSGNLILKRADNSTFSAGMARGAQGDPAVYNIPYLSDQSNPRYVRLAVLDGNSTSGGAHLEGVISGVGSIGSTKRGTVQFHAAQRGVGVVEIEAWGFGFLTSSVAASVKLFTRQTGDFMFEIWAQFSSYSPSTTLSVQSNLRTALTLDGARTTAPSSLVQWPIKILDPNFATNAEAQAKTASDVMLTPANLAALLATSSLAGLIEIASQTEINAGTNNSRAVTPLVLRNLVYRAWAEAAGSFETNTSLASEQFKDYSVVFPAGRFTVPPNVFFSSTSVRAGIAAEVTPTTTGMTVRVFNSSGLSTVASGTMVRWHAIQMSPSAANG